MASGTPVVASNLPGVREPVMITGMGRVVAPADAHALAEGINNVLDHPERFSGDADDVIRRFSSQHIAEEYTHLFQELVEGPISNK
jgi:glycosyltransferase involved in cell wall biosynthesis